jgi:PAS domain-containing protein/CheY-like chemotaxis protein
VPSPDYVLIAEPHHATAAAITRAVAQAFPGCACVVTSDGNAGHEILAKQGLPTLMIVELALPKRDGFSLVRGLRRFDKERRVKVIATSAFPALRKSATEMNAELGPMSVIAKPIVHEGLVNAIRSALASQPGLSSTPAPALASMPSTPTRPAFTPSAPTTPPAASVEAQRLARIEEMGITLDAPSDAELQRILEDVASEFSVPTALVTIVLEGKQWFKSFVGLGGDLLANRGSPRGYSFCHHVVEGREALVVPDARENPTFQANPLVLDGTIAGYAGAPIVTPHGEVLGSLCILDRKALTIGASDIDKLRLVARRVAGELELAAGLRRRERSRLEASRGSVPPRSPSAPPLPMLAPVAWESRRVALECLAAATASLASGVVVFDATRRVLFANDAFGGLFDLRDGEMVGARRDAFLARLSDRFADPEDAIARLAAPEDGPFAFCEELSLADGRAVRWTATPVDLPGGTVQILGTSDATFAR